MIQSTFNLIHADEGDRLLLSVRKPAVLVENSTFDSLTVGTWSSCCIMYHETSWITPSGLFCLSRFLHGTKPGSVRVRGQVCGGELHVLR